ncbi:MAG: replicative DNA helicase [Candidatus Shikimatogenerans bostrichidophilus]|nr:MAG: replicative DNA helicase [Candidatus Shikimatogenerans bostrichidophilus]
MILNKKSLEEGISLLNSEIFYKKRHRIIFKYILILYSNDKKIDLLTLESELKKDNMLKKVGGVIYLTYLINNSCDFEHIREYIFLIIEKFIIRYLIKLSCFILFNIRNNKVNILNFLNIIQNNIDNIYLKYTETNLTSLKDLLPQTLENINKKEFIPTGFKKLDNIIIGLQESDLIIIASRPGMGKSSLALSLILNIISRKIPVGLFSLEMSSINIISRLIIFESNITYKKLNTSNLNLKEYNLYKRTINKINNYPLYIDDTPYLSLIDFKNKCRMLIKKYNVKLIVIDYLQLISVDDVKYKNREQEISTISRNIKNIAKELKITIIAISQLSRAVEIRGGYKRPMLSDLRESGAIEQDADIVLLLYRPEYYGFKYWNTENKSICKGEAEIIIAKHRNGKLGKIRLRFIKKKAYFTNI